MSGLRRFVEQKYIKALDGEILLDNSRYIIDAQERFSVNDSFYAMPVGMDTDVIFIGAIRFITFLKHGMEL